MVMWNDPSLSVASDSARTARYRRLQSWYREVQLGITEPGIGANGRPVASMLPVASAAELNFLAPAAHEHAERRIQEVRKEGGTLEEDRLRRNLLSSMPLCFNIFGALGEHPAFLELLRRVIDPSAARVTEVICEWAPRPASRYLDDRSAFDAMVRYEDDKGCWRFIGVETKYTEPFSPKEYPSDRYREIAEASGWFVAGAYEKLRDTATNQLFRTVLLAAASEGLGAFVRGEVLLLTTADDQTAHAVASEVAGHLVDPDRLRHVTYERLVDEARAVVDPYLAGWADRFELRYLNPDSLGQDRLPDPRGPRVGQALTEPGT